MNCKLRSLCVIFMAGLMLLFVTGAGAQQLSHLPLPPPAPPQPADSPPPGQPPGQTPTQTPGQTSIPTQNSPIQNSPPQSTSTPPAAPLQVQTPPPASPPPQSQTPQTQTPATPPPPNERTMIIDVRSRRGSEVAFEKSLTEHLRRRGMNMLASRKPEPDRPCDTIECMEELAKREDAGIVIYTQVEESTAGSYTIDMALFDAVRRVPFTQREDCTQCSPDLLTYKLNDLADKLISHCREARLITPLPTQGVPVVPPLSGPSGGNNPWTYKWTHPKNERGYFSHLSPTRKVLAAVLGGLAGAALVSTVALTVTNGHDTPLGCTKRTDVLQDKCILNDTALVASGYVLTGALVVGIGFTLFWPTKKKTQEVR